MAFSRFIHRRRWDDERAEELRAYLAQEIDDNMARGLSRDEATRAAHRRLGNPTRIREEIYDMNTIGVLETLWQDLRYGARLLRKNPTFAIVAIVTLALGTGANAAIFQLVNAVRLRTLPVERPQELVEIAVDYQGRGRVGRGMRGRSIHTEPLWRALQADHAPFSGIIAWGFERWDLSTEGEVRSAEGFYVSGSYFDVLGVRPFAGRLFTDADDQKGCGSPGAVLSHAFWQSRYGSNRGVIGQPITLDRHAFEIIGVAPPQFFGVEVGKTFDVMIPLCAEPIIRGAQNGTGRADFWWLDVMGRLKADWTIERADAYLKTISPAVFAATVSPRYKADIAESYKGFKFTANDATTGVSNIRSAYATELWILLGATALVLLIACANLANLMLARATARDREVAVRMAIGASRWRIVRQMLSESLLIAALGAAGGLLVARWLSHALVAFLSSSNDRIFMDLALDWRVFAFITLVAVAACLIFGLTPALKATGASPARSMQGGGRSHAEGHEAFAMRRALVVVQVALSTVLVVGAVLFARSLNNITSVDAGFRAEGVVDMAIDLRRTAIKEDARHQAMDELLARVRSVPGVLHASETFVAPISGSEWNGRISVNGARVDGMVYFNQVGPEFFRTMETPLLMGRTFGPEDKVGAPLAAVVSETFARRFFPNGSAIGQTFALDVNAGQTSPVYQIVGVARDTKYGSLREDARPIAYLAYDQEPQLLPYLDILVRSDLPLSALAPALTRTATEVAPGAAVSYDTLTGFINDSLVTERLMASLSAFFGILAMLIATIGLYGVMSYMVTRRRVEIGIRMALGADARTVVRMVVGESGVLVLAGVVIGGVLAVVGARSAASLLFGLSPWDPSSFALAVAALGFVSLCAAWIPARRASRVAPSIALRD
ncbi:MAG TPA: ABC transporter permease [Vicinamibacterales bacterium]